MTTRKLHSTNERRQAPVKKGTIAIVAAAAIAGGLAITHESNTAYKSLPACEVTVKGGDTLSGIENRLGNPQENVGVTVLESNGRTPADISVPQFDLHAGMVVRAPHEDPTVCRNIGGTVITPPAAH